MKITAKNAAVGTSAEDIIAIGGNLTEPVTERIHAIVSTSSSDDNNGTSQVETATVAGTIDGILQVETATVSGTIGASGAGNVEVVITGNLVSGSPLTIPVAVANDDTAAQVAGKIRTALGISAITTHYTVGGSSATVTLTTKAKAANDTSLNIYVANGTASGLVDAPTSVNTTAGHAGTGNVTVVVTGALVTGSPRTFNVAVVTGDTAAVVAGKIRTALNIAAITDNYTIGGSTTAVVLTAKDGAANDTSLNIAVADGTSNGITTAATSANTTAGVAPVGACQLEILGRNNAGTSIGETVSLDGTNPVNTTKTYLYINSMKVIKVGTAGANVGVITATAATDNSVTCTIEAGKNNCQQAFFMAVTGSVKNFCVSAFNATSGAYTTVEIMSKKRGAPWITEMIIQLSEVNPEYRQADAVYQYPGSNTLLKIRATASAGSSAVAVTMDI